MFFFVLQFDEDIEDIDGILLAKLHRELIPSSFNICKQCLSLLFSFRKINVYQFLHSV